MWLAYSSRQADQDEYRIVIPTVSFVDSLSPCICVVQ